LILCFTHREKYINDTINGKYKPDWIGEKLGIPSTGGGLNGTAYDLVRFGNMILSGGTLDGARVLGRKSVERMTSQSILKPTYCWENNGDIVDFGIGFNRCRRSMFTFSENTFWHEGAGACALYIDPAEEMVAVWITESKQKRLLQYWEKSESLIMKHLTTKYQNFGMSILAVVVQNMFAECLVFVMTLNQRHQCLTT